jgi:signal transduction histidine kinase
VLDRLAQGEDVSAYESQHVTKSGTQLDVSVTVSAIKDPGGRVIGSSAIVRDISSTKRTRESLELAVQQERLMVEKLTDLDRVRTSFVSSVSHELRTPLTSILGYLELLTDDPSGMNEHQREMLDIVSRNSKRLFALIEDLLVLSRIESGAFKVLKEPVEVRALIGAVAREMAPNIAAASHRLSVSIDDEVGSVLGDPGELERLLLSLLSNAIKFTPPGGEIVVSADSSGDGTTIVVSDTGLGIPENDVAEVFNPFFRSAVADRRAIPGTGLGLPIAKTIVEQHGGTISCESEPGQGTRIIVHLPFAIQQRKAS